MKEYRGKLFLLDAMALIYRAFFALNKNPRINSKGLNTSAILGFANTLYDVLKNEKPTHIGVAFDTSTPTHRHREFETYKAHREAMPEDLSIALPYIVKMIEAFNIPVLIREGYEADDIIGTLAKKAESEGFEVFMMTSDKDFGQLVSDNIKIFKPARMGDKAEVMGIAEVCAKFDIENPLQVIDMLGLWGDVSDNIPGIPGVGEVTARKLIKQFGSVENMLERIDEIENEKLREKVKTHAQQARDSKYLATILLDVPIELDEEKLRLKDPDREELQQQFKELEFNAFAKRIFTDISVSDVVKRPTAKTPSAQFDMFGAEEPELFVQNNFNTIENTQHQYHLADTKEKRADLISKLKTIKEFCYDTETTGLDAHDCELVGLSFSIKAHEAWYIPVPENQAEAQQLVDEFKLLFEDESIGKIGQNMKFDIAVLNNYGITVRGSLFDTMLAHYLLEPDMRHGMDALAQNYLNYIPVSIETLIGKKGKNQQSMRLVDLEQIKEYAAEDADITFQLKETFEPKLAEDFTRKLFDEVEMPLVPVLASMEAEGVRIDPEMLSKFSAELATDIRKIELEIYELAGSSFNIASPLQLGKILYDHLRIVDNPKQTKTKQYSTGEEVLVKLIHKHPIVQKILDYRSLTKLKSTYVEPLPKLINAKTGRIHTSYNQAVAATGRLSSNNPNLQNIPIRTDLGSKIREAFVPRNDDFTLLSADYSQIELRIIASLSGDEAMCEAFRSGEDIHTQTASKIFCIPVEEITSEMRRSAKTVNFGIVYGISAFGLSERLNIPRKQAADFIDQYFKTFPGIKRYMESTIEQARNQDYVQTILGRRRYLRDIHSSNANIRGFAERNAINAPIQGSSADMIKIAMIRIWNVIQKENLQSKMIMQVHDELVFDVYKPETERIKSIIEEGMKNALPLNVPVEIEMNTGNNWLEAH